MNVDTNQRPPMTNQDGTAFNDNNLSNNTEPFTGTRTQRTYRNKVVDKGKRRTANLRTKALAGTQHRERRKREAIAGTQQRE